MLCDLRGHFLFEVRPDVFPQGFLTYTEIELWARYYDHKNKEK
jgi:hypothetical protein